MIYESKSTNLSKQYDTYELAHGTIRRNELSFQVAEISQVIIHKRFDGFLFAKITGDHGTISIGSHSAVGFGKAVENRKPQVVAFLTELLNQLPVTCRIQVGSNGWKWTGIFMLGLVGLAVTLLLVVLVVMTVGQPTGRSTMDFPWGKLALLPVVGFAGWRIVRLGGKKVLTRDETKNYLASV